MNKRFFSTALASVVLGSIVLGQDANDLQKQESRLQTRIIETILSGGETAFADELQQLRDDLVKVQAELKKMKAPNMEQTNHGWISGFFQNQYTYTESVNGPNNAFRMRRQRLNYNHMGNDKTMGRISVEFSAGTNQSSAQIRDAFIQYRPNTFLKSSGPTFTFGQQNTPLGYEINYPSWARTWVERSYYENAYFNGERGRGVIYQNGTPTNYWFAGAFNALTVNDAEQVNLPSGQDGEVGPIGGVRARQGAWEYGVSGFYTRRPRYTSGATAPRGDRYFTYVDGRFNPKHSPWDVRWEYMIGRDRIPAGTANASNSTHPTTGYHINVDHKLNRQDILVFRFENFDRNPDVSNDTLQMYGIGFVRDVNEYFRIRIAEEWITDSARASINQTSYHLLTIRAQFRF